MNQKSEMVAIQIKLSTSEKKKLSYLIQQTMLRRLKAKELSFCLNSCMYVNQRPDGRCLMSSRRPHTRCAPSFTGWNTLLEELKVHEYMKL
jgi:hypothetical protein